MIKEIHTIYMVQQSVWIHWSCLGSYNIFMNLMVAHSTDNKKNRKLGAAKS